MENTHLILRVQAQHPGASRCPPPRSEIGPAPSRVVPRSYPAGLVTPVTLEILAGRPGPTGLFDYCRDLERATAFFGKQNPVRSVRADLQAQLDQVIVEQDDRIRLAHT